jgi:cytochrome c-type biogenesis protein CcmE
MGTKAKVALTVAILAGGVAYMIVTTVSSGEALVYYKHVDEVMADPAAWTGRTLQLHGNVVQGTIVKREGSLDFKFALHRGGRWMEVAYSGLVPDSFRDCAELVVKGELQSSGTFSAHELSAKCPSKYDDKRRAGLCAAALRDQVLERRR